MLSVTELRGSNLCISIHDLKYIDASIYSAANPEAEESSKQLVRKDESDRGNYKLLNLQLVCFPIII